MILEHNQEAYEAIKKMLKAYKECCLVAATGIGKSNIITELLKELGLNALVIVPSLSINSNWNELYEKYDTEYFSVITYHYFKLHYKNLYGFDAYIFDEAHHMGAKEWGKAIKDFKSELIDELFIGATADDNRYFDDDIKTVANTFFNGDHVVYGLNQQEAIERGILPRAKYICAIYNVEEVFAKYKTIELTDELKGKLNYTIQNCKSIENILQENIPSNNYTKGIVFVDNIKNIDTGVELVKKAFPNEPIYFIHSKLGKKNSERILNEFRKAKSGFIVSVNMLNEGNHIKGVNTIIMLRKTSSPSLYTQQIGRGLAAGSDDTTIFDLIRNDTSIKKVLARIRNMEDVYCNNNDKESKTEDGANKPYNRSSKISDQFIVKDEASDILEIFDTIEEYINGNKYRRWTKEEDDILREFYASMGSEVYTMLHMRSESACRARANQLNIYTDSHFWSEEEDNIIKEFYPSMGSKVASKLPGRSECACKYRANQLNISTSQRYWSKEEDDILRKFYPSMGSKVASKLPGRTESACKHRIKVLNIHLSVRKSWSEEEDNIIKEFYPSMGSKVASKLPGRSKDACLARANKLKIYVNSNEWSKEEDDILKEFYPSMGVKVASKLPGRTEIACGARANLLNVYINTVSWSKEEDDILRKFYPSMGVKVASKLHGRTKDACSNRAIKLGIRTDRIWSKEEDDILKEFYPSMGVKVTSKLPGRSISSCRNRVNQLNIYKNMCYWSKEEDDILKEFYPSIGAKVASKLPGRSPNSCRSRANVLNIYKEKVCKKKPKWSKEEDDILKEFYPSIGSKVASKLPGRSECACNIRARKILHI